MALCKECGKEFVTGVKDCCSMDCFKKDLKKRIEFATKNDESHTEKFSKEK